MPPLRPDSIILACTSGNTGISLAHGRRRQRLPRQNPHERIREGRAPPPHPPTGGEVQLFAAALAMTRRLSREFGLLVGTSSGANITAALRTARDLPPTAKVVTILCDRAERDYSTKLFAEPPAP